MGLAFSSVNRRNSASWLTGFALLIPPYSQYSLSSSTCRMRLHLLVFLVVLLAWAGPAAGQPVVKRSPQDDPETVTPVWCNFSSPFRSLIVHIWDPSGLTSKSLGESRELMPSARSWPKEEDNKSAKDKEQDDSIYFNIQQSTFTNKKLDTKSTKKFIQEHSQFPQSRLHARPPD